MNERIRELYLQAHMVRKYPDDDPMRGGDPPTVYWGGELSAEKFSELIVRECVQVSLKTSHRDDDMGTIIGRQMLKHFGVEE